MERKQYTCRLAEREGNTKRVLVVEALSVAIAAAQMNSGLEDEDYKWSVEPTTSSLYYMAELEASKADRVSCVECNSEFDREYVLGENSGLEGISV